MPEILVTAPTTTSLQARTTQDNALICSAYKMGLNEKRLLMLAISKLNPLDALWKASREGVYVDVTKREWGDAYGLSGKTIYGQLKRATKGLYDRSVEIEDGPRSGSIRWVSAIWNYEGEDRIRIVFSGPILNYLSGLQNNFTSYDLFGIRGLKSMYSIRLYEISKMIYDKGKKHSRSPHKTYEIDDIRKLLNVGASYPAFKELRRCVLDKAVNEVNSKTPLQIELKPIKEGRSFKKLLLIVTLKEQLPLL